MNPKLCLLLFGVVAVCSAAGGGGGGGGGAEEVLSLLGDDEDSSRKNVDLIVGKTLILECNQEKNERLSFKWTKDEKDVDTSDNRINAYSNGTLIITDAAKNDTGFYTCKDDKADSLTIEFYVYTLKIARMRKSATFIELEKMNITCEASGTPRPTISWLKEDKPLVAGEHVHFETSVKNEDMAFNSTVLIDETQFDDRGHYTCIVEWGFGGSANMTTNVRVKGLYAALWPFLGIVAEVFVLCCIIFFFERRRSNQDFEESDTDTGKNGN